MDHGPYKEAQLHQTKEDTIGNVFSASINKTTICLSHSSKETFRRLGTSLVCQLSGHDAGFAVNGSMDKEQ